MLVSSHAQWWLQSKIGLFRFRLILLQLIARTIQTGELGEHSKHIAHSKHMKPQNTRRKLATFANLMVT
jgi:hypothetical protein